MTERAGKLIFSCNDCGYDKVPEEGKAVKLYERSIKETTGFDIDLNNIHLLGKDPINPRIYAKCEKCKSDVLLYVISHDEMTRMLICPECNTYWIP